MKKVSKAGFVTHGDIPASVPILCEFLSLLEFAVLRLSPVYYGFGVPRGDGRAVVVIPGFLGSDLSLMYMYRWLARIGYRPYISGMGIVADCPNVLAQTLARTIDHAYAETGRPVHLIGHSLGGIIARSTAVRTPDRIASVITLGSPFRGLAVHRLVIKLANAVRRRARARRNLPDGCGTSRCSCAFARSLKRKWPRSVAQTAIYTCEDGIVDWRYCITGDPKADVQVCATHLGLVFNPGVFLKIAERLAGLQGGGLTRHDSRVSDRSRRRWPVRTHGS